MAIRIDRNLSILIGSNLLQSLCLSTDTQSSSRHVSSNSRTILLRRIFQNFLFHLEYGFGRRNFPNFLLYTFSSKPEKYDKIDNEYKILFQGIFNVAAARGDAGALKNLIDNVVFHFNEEQGIMEKANYSEYPAHKQLHVDFIAKLKGISCPVSDDSVHFAKEWLVNHIKNTDFKYKGKL